MAASNVPVTSSAVEKRQAGTLIVVGGPTASGKSAAAVALAKHFRTEVVSADSRQFYHQLRIGAASPTMEEMQGVRHHFVGHLSVEETMSAGAFARSAVPVIEDLLVERGTVVLVGGSGLYIDAVLNGFDPMPLGDHRIRTELQERFRRDGLDPLLQRLAELDPAIMERIDQRNPHRVIRALEVCLTSGRPYSAQRSGNAEERPWKSVCLAMDLPREELYRRIDARFDAMMTAGLLEEARSLFPFRHLNALQTVGYRELFLHMAGELDLASAVALAKQHTRNFAKRQLTWLRRSDAWNWVPPSDISAMAGLVEGAP